MSSVDLGTVDQLTIISSSTEDHRNVRSAAVTFGDDKLFCVDDTAVLDNVAGDRVVVLDRLSRHCLQASNLRVNGGLVATETPEDLLARNGIGLIDSVVRAVCGAIVAIKTESTASTEVTLRDRSGNQIFVDDSGRTEKSTN